MSSGPSQNGLTTFFVFVIMHIVVCCTSAPAYRAKQTDGCFTLINSAGAAYLTYLTHRYLLILIHYLMMKNCNMSDGLQMSVILRHCKEGDTITVR